jgi:RecA/RadA recombinase
MRLLSLLLLASLSVLPACRREETVAVEEEPIGVESFQQVMPVGGRVELPGHGEEVWFGYGAMAGTSWDPANGVVTGHTFEDGIFVFTMNLNVAQAKEGTFYEVWLKDPKTDESLSAGHLTNAFGDARHGLRYEYAQDLSDFTNVIVTLERDDGDPAMTTHVIATGTLKETKR